MTHKQAGSVLATGLVWMLVLAAACAWAQQAENPLRVGIPQDWTQHYLLFSRDGLAQHPDLVYNEPRVIHQMVQRSQAANSGIFHGADTIQRAPGRAPHRDWSVGLGFGRVAPNMFPAKYSFDPGAAPDCTNDYVVFGLNIASTATQANLVAFNNLYVPAGICPGAVPTVLFAYSIKTIASGRILDSPALSVDGKKIAFVESGSGNSIFHVLTWAPGGAIGAPVTPGAAMTSLTYAAALDTRSAPWIDYNSDTAYVGADDGRIYKITGVFKGTPTLAGAPWPVTVSTNLRPSGPVLDKNLGLLMVGSQNGTLYQINVATGAVKSLVVGRSGATNPGILAPPIVDVSNGTTFVVSANDGTSGGILVEADTASMTVMATAHIGLASKNVSHTAVSLYQPAFDNNYFNSPSTGVVRLCGTGGGDITPWQYEFGFTGKTLNPTFIAAGTNQLVNDSTVRCTGWSEFFNPNIGGGTDFFFFGLTANCSGVAGTSGCVVARTDDDAAPNLKTFNVTGGPTGIVVDNYSTAAQASSIYLTGARAPNNAYKLTQNGLN